MRTPTILSLSVVLFFGTLLGCDGPANTPGVGVDLESTRIALTPYQDISEARSDGYRPDGPLMGHWLSGIGVVFDNPTVTTLDPLWPRRLYYHIHEDGTYELYGGGWQVEASDTDAPPWLFGQELSEPTLVWEPGRSPLYRLNVWLFRENPFGMFAEFHQSTWYPFWWTDYLRALHRAEALTDFESAREAGFVYDGDYVVERWLGGIGLVMLHGNSRGAELDLEHPHALLFLERGNEFVLAALQWRLPATELLGKQKSLLGQPWQGPFYADDTGEPYYSITLWPYHHNSKGIFTPFISHRLYRYW